MEAINWSTVSLVLGVVVGLCIPTVTKLVNMQRQIDRLEYEARQADEKYKHDRVGYQRVNLEQASFNREMDKALGAQDLAAEIVRLLKAR